MSLEEEYETEYLKFIRASFPEKDNPIYKIENKIEGKVLGDIRYDSGWDSYIFRPEPGTFFDKEALGSIQEKIEMVENEVLEE